MNGAKSLFLLLLLVPASAVAKPLYITVPRTFSTTERAQVKVAGIPADSTNNELGPWIHNARLAQFRMKQEGKVSDEYVIVVKADKDTPYPAIQKVINTLIDINVNKFNLITSQEADPNKTKAL